MSWFLAHPPDFSRHNEEVAAVWAAYHEGRPTRVPVSVTGSIRNFIQNPDLNTTGYTFADFFTDPEAQVQCQLAYQKWCRYQLLCDREMGPPKDGWTLGIDFQNSYDAGWFGCPLRSDGNAVPDTVEILKEDKHRLYGMSCPDPVRGGLLARALEFYEYMHDRCCSLEFEGLPVHPPRSLPGEGCDGPLDAAYKLRGAAELCLDMVEDPQYFHDLMGFVTDSLIRRMKALRQWRWARWPDSPDRGQFRRPGFGFADDAIVLLSVPQYQQFVYPYHRRLVDEFSDGGRTAVHLCGDAARFFPFLRDHLNVYSFDTGFPLDHGAVRRALGPQVQINGGPTVMQIQEGPVSAIRESVRRICRSGVMEGGRFVLIAANNLAPCTPVEHVVALYEAAKEFGRYG
ncbi:MAG: uroporphyrinogen decarboxylase family protein [Candidatus Latescibacterota bacterium]